MVIYGAENLSNKNQAHDLLALAARELWGWDALPSIEKGPHGKPCFPGVRGREFNLSHSGSLALCALSERPVGVDIQIVKSHRPGLPRRVCFDKELAWLEAGEDLWSRFTLLWTMKESRVKYSGEGLTQSIAGISVPLPEAGETLYCFDGLWFRLYAGADWYAAACGEEEPPPDILWRSL